MGGVFLAEKKSGKAKLQTDVDRYFRSISREVLLTETAETGETDEKGKPITEKRAVLNALGETVYVTEYLLPPTRQGLLHYIGLTAEEWHALAGTARHRRTVQEAEERLVDWRFRQILTLPGKDIRGLIFDLEQNYAKAPPAEAAPPPLSLQEKLQCLRELSAEFRDIEEQEDSELCIQPMNG